MDRDSTIGNLTLLELSNSMESRILLKSLSNSMKAEEVTLLGKLPEIKAD